MESIIQSITKATDKDIPAILSLLNKSFRGEESQRGWTSEAHLIAGPDRTDEATIREVYHKPGSVFFKYVNEEGTLIGCVNLQQEGEDMYLGMLGVDPYLQGGGIGKKLMQVSEQYAKEQGVRRIHMTVISVRQELIDWYKRQGYEDRGVRKEFKEDGKSGTHLQKMEFIVLEKNI
jgi:N-acetylglutamate synthase-like GNAT family acetyltransferase